MAMIFDVLYPDGERAYAVGYAVRGTTVIVDIVPRGPEACFHDELEVDFAPHPCPVIRIVGGPRRRTIHVRLADTTEAERELWMNARDAEGWNTRDESDDPELIYVVAMQDGLERESLACDGAVIVDLVTP